MRGFYIERIAYTLFKVLLIANCEVSTSIIIERIAYTLFKVLLIANCEVSTSIIIERIAGTHIVGFLILFPIDRN